ncbi:MAG: sulfur carrier protein ThiS adenylyltransferase ThiF, partial [Candidatus Fermentibacteraceae bacterium]|nr:sulfur carrier protein ThiS adenylyltransferase ThiF [Candidatus Fermentibacteraceae bacterium]
IFRDCPDGLADAFSQVRFGIAGAGGIGSNVAALLVRAGASSLVVADFDKVETSNLNRQFYFSDQVGEPKVEALAHNLHRINGKLEVETHSTRLTRNNVCSVFEGCDFLIEAVDDSATKAFLIEEWSTGFPEKRIVACSGIAGTSGQSEITTERTGNLSVVGDHHSTLEQGTFSAMVTAVAASMVSEIYFLLTDDKCASCDGCKPGGVSLECNGVKVPLIGFPAKMLENTVRGMVSSLKGADHSGSIKIEI